MTYLEDLSEYAYYDLAAECPGTKAIGWLGRGHRFPTNPPSKEVLDTLWAFCSVSVALTRGIHECEFCPSGAEWTFERGGQKLLLGAAEIRVFSEDGRVYAAPTLIYHYVLTHHYNPPEEFLEALRYSPRPPNRNYFDRLENLGLEWHLTSSGGMRLRLSAPNRHQS